MKDKTRGQRGPTEANQDYLLWHRAPPNSWENTPVHVRKPLETLLMRNLAGKRNVVRGSEGEYDDFPFPRKYQNLLPPNPPSAPICSKGKSERHEEESDGPGHCQALLLPEPRSPFRFPQAGVSGEYLSSTHCPKWPVRPSRETKYLICDTSAGKLLCRSGSEKTRFSNRCLLCSSHVTWNFFKCSFS